MKIVIFGLTISSAWGNGHATLLRGLCRALHAKGHQVSFFERDTTYYATHRDATSFPYVRLYLYSSWNEISSLAQRELKGADAGIVTSYCVDGVAASRLLLETDPYRAIFYDMDTPVTLSRLEHGESVPYLPPEGLAEFDFVLTYTGGRTANLLREILNAKHVFPLYGWVDTAAYYPVTSDLRFKGDLSYLGTHSPDREKAFENLFLKPAGDMPANRFVVGGAMYKDVGRWPGNVRYFEHVAPPDHCAFYSSARFTLNITRSSMAAIGYCPSGRLFEASACGAAVISDWWEGLDTFFKPQQEILIVSESGDVAQALQMDAQEVENLGKRARERTLDCHTADIRAQELVQLLETPANASLGQPDQFSLIEEM
jgi:spore maturation protein CgeB